MKIFKQKDNIFLSARLKLDFLASLFVLFVLVTYSYTIYRLLTVDIIYQISPVFKNTDISSFIDSEKLFSNFKEQTIFLLIVSDFIVFLIAIFIFDKFIKKMLAPIEYLSDVQKKFAENVSHELRTPLSIINMHGEILKEKIEKEKNLKKIDDEKFINDSEHGVDTILEEVKGITTLIDDLLFEARIKYTEDKERIISLKEVESILRKIEKNIEHNKSVEVSFVIQNSISKNDLSKNIKVNPFHLERIFNNLISNSFKFTNSGEVRVRLETYRSQMKKYLRIAVIDTGIGIKKEDLKKVSERFFRGENVEGQIAGTGIGLSIVKDIVSDNAWKFKIISEEEQGTTVEVSHISIL